MAVKEVIGFSGGVIEPQRFSGGQWSADGGCGGVYGSVRQHFPVTEISGDVFGVGMNENNWGDMVVN